MGEIVEVKDGLQILISKEQTQLSLFLPGESILKEDSKVKMIIKQELSFIQETKEQSLTNYRSKLTKEELKNLSDQMKDQLGKNISAQKASIY